MDDEIPVIVEEPATAPQVDEAALDRLRTVAYLLDEAIAIPGTDVRIGLDPLLGAVPGVGDALSAGVSLYVVLEAANLGVSYATIIQMLGNVAIDAAVGSVPILGTVFDAFWKANAWNVELIEEELGVDLADSTPEDDGDDAIVIEVED
jgi:hypothetical protein